MVTSQEAVYRATFDMNMLVVMPLPGGFWDTPWPQYTIEDSDDETKKEVGDLQQTETIDYADYLDSDMNSNNKSVSSPENSIGNNDEMADFPIEDDDVLPYSSENFHAHQSLPRSGSMKMKFGSNASNYKLAVLLHTAKSK
jgi:hypothetical protein